MPLTFYPHPDDTQKGSYEDRIELLMEAAERYKAIVLDATKPEGVVDVPNKRAIPKDQAIAYNWEEIAILLREVRSLPEGSKSDKVKKAELLLKLSEAYEVLRAAKMSKLEAVRLALLNEAKQLQAS